MEKYGQNFNKPINFKYMQSNKIKNIYWSSTLQQKLAKIQGGWSLSS